MGSRCATLSLVALDFVAACKPQGKVVDLYTDKRNLLIDNEKRKGSGSYASIIGGWVKINDHDLWYG